MEKVVHVVDGINGDAETPYLALRKLVVGVVAGQRWVIEVGADTCLAVFQQETVSFVGRLSRAEARNLSASPEAAAVHIGIGAAGEGKLAGTPQIPV